MADSPRNAESAPPARVAPSSPALNSALLLRATGICAAAAALMGGIVAPGLRGNATDGVVLVSDRVSASLAYLLYGMLLMLLGRGCLAIYQSARVPVATQIVIFTGAAITCIIAAPALTGRLPSLWLVVLTTSAPLAVLPAAWSALRAPHTRAVAVVLTLLGIAALTRLIAWELATVAGEQASLRLFNVSKGVATVGVALEALGQVVAVAWIGTRTRIVGQVMSSLALAGAYVMTWAGMQERHSTTPLWQAIFHSALADAAGPPRPFALTIVATFLASAAILLALVVVAQRRQVAVVVSAMALALISRGAFDVPLRALAAIVAAIWCAIAVGDDRAMWRDLTASRVAPTPKYVPPALPPR